MGSIYLIIVIFLLILAIFDLFVGVSNDAVNFLQSAIGAKVAKFRTVLIIASFGVMLGAVMSTGMMDVARHGVLVPTHYSFQQVMTIFLAVMVTDVIVLDMFNTLGMPTSTTVSLVFELLGGTFMMAVLMVNQDPNLEMADLINSQKALDMIVSIFASVIVAFIVGVIVQWITRIIFTFNYQQHSRYTIAIFGGIAFTALSYFIFLKGFGKSPYIPESVRDYINGNINMLMVYTFVISAVLMEVLYLMKVNVFKFLVLMGTFGLAMSFASNDLVNFIGVPLAGLDSYQDYIANGNGASPSEFMMSSLMESAKSPALYLFGAGVIMIIAMGTSKKARNVIKTSVDLSRQDESDEMFGSSRVARSLVRCGQATNSFIANHTSDSVCEWVDSRFDKKKAKLDNGAAFDVVRAAVNLVLASMLITFGTNHKLPLSTTYVTFMVAMGSSLADRAWGRESAVFRVTGVLSVIGGWFITAAVAFIVCSIVCCLMWFGGIIMQGALMVLVVYLLIRSNRNFNKRSRDKKEDVFQLMMRTKDPEIVWDLLTKHFRRNQAEMTQFAYDEYNKVVDGFEDNRPRELRHANRELRRQQVELRTVRRQELLALRRAPERTAMERNTWFHVSINASQQYIYCIIRMLEPIKEHIDNNFNPLPQTYIAEYEPVRHSINDLLKQTENLISTGRFENYRRVLEQADNLKDMLSVIRKKHIDRMQSSTENSLLKISVVYLNLLQESQQLLSNMRHQLRGTKKFTEEGISSLDSDFDD
ncbi:MAG: inorganic phosphate transporter [Prevotella sp.]|jgi:phosphate/sulfate permease